MTTPKTPLPWERQDDETDVAWNAFVRYRDYAHGERSLPRLASDMVGENPGRDPEQPRKPKNVQRELERWSSVHKWRDRVEAWDRELDRQARDKHVDEVVEMRRRHARQMEALLAAGMAPVTELLQRIRDQSLVLAEVKSGELFKLLVAFSRVAPAIVQAERQARGEPHDAPAEQVTPVAPGEMPLTDDYVVEMWAVLEDLGITPQPATIQTPDQEVAGEPHN